MANDPQLLKQLGVSSFQQRFPWFGGDLQTLRDTFRTVDLPDETGRRVLVDVPALQRGRRNPDNSWPFLINRIGSPVAWCCCCMAWEGPVPGKA